jgi:hypothetical protein
MESLHAGFDLVAIDQAHRVMPTGQAGHEGLVALQAFFIQAVQFHNRFFMVIDTQVELGVVFIGVDAQGRTLFATLVTACGFAGGHGSQQTPCHGLACTGLVGAGGFLHHFGACEHVARHTEVVKAQMAAPIDAGRTSVGMGCPQGW